MPALQVLMVGGTVAAPPPPGSPVSIAPTSTFTSSRTDFASASDFTASFTGTPTSIVWSVEGMSNCSAAVIAGQGTPTATIRLTTNDSGGLVASGSCTVRCTAVIGGVSYSSTATKTHNFRYSDGGGVGGPL